MNYSTYRHHSVQGRYVSPRILFEKWLGHLNGPTIKVVGKSVEERPIHSITLGNGIKRVLMWSQMHGNESTTTKAVMDLINFLGSNNPLSNTIIDNCTLCIIPMLNPDGSNAYTRVNANQVDLNRDAKNQTQPESKVLREIFDTFEPDFCLNLHGQRTLFSAGNTDKPATVSFLSPSSNPERDITPAREVAMKLIVAMSQNLQSLIPGQIGRYDDSFNDNCVGDTFQMMNVPTILFEAGHHPKDYEREKTREYIFQSLVECLKTIAMDKIDEFETSHYFDIPENQKLFYDIFVKSPHMVNPKLSSEAQIGISYREELNENTIQFIPEIAAVGNLKGKYGHEYLNCSKPEDFKALVSKEEILELVREAK
ncbi:MULTISPECIES: M14 metallopeptidase family protein [Flavobacteriaceae]|uniref:M14 family metallopeptidase n=1 Tax=Flavobacteriaceae TaxID=49546 RepID=UPI001C0F0849|nr:MULTISPECIES: M14 metallopeptidase family protein [Allomuricauda]MDC6364593.1 M14 family metallopeptidase [Muricauda sp. AC10]